MEISNQWQQALWYLINWKSFSLSEVINDSMFYKFQSRLSEIESEHGEICERSTKVFTNRFGRTSKCTIYECIDVDKARELILKYK